MISYTMCVPSATPRHCAKGDVASRPGGLACPQLGQEV